MCQILGARILQRVPPCLLRSLVGTAAANLPTSPGRTVRTRSESAMRHSVIRTPSMRISAGATVYTDTRVWLTVPNYGFHVPRMVRGKTARPYPALRWSQMCFRHNTLPRNQKRRNSVQRLSAALRFLICRNVLDSHLIQSHPSCIQRGAIQRHVPH